MKRLIIMTFLFAVQLAAAAPPKLIREIGLDQIIPGHPEFASASLVFSPDEKWIAIVGSYHVDRRSAPLHVGPSGSASVFLVPRDGPVDGRIQIDPGLYVSGGASWSPNSDSFVVQGLTRNPPPPNAAWTAKLLNLRGEELSHHEGAATVKDRIAGQVFGFLDAEHLLVGGVSAKKTAALETIDLQGKGVDTWTVPKQWRVVDMSPDRHLIAVLSDDQAAKTLVVDYASKKVVLTKDNPYQNVSLGDRDRETAQYFTEGGKTLCSVGSAQISDPKFDVATECWDVDSGKRIAKFNGILGGAPAAASSRGSRLLLTHYILVRSLRPPDPTSVKYVVWDFRSDTEIAAWELSQTPMRIPPHLSSIAISSTGRFLAEIVGGVFRIYELP